jgi:GNAT superfamily N-acetyltransferase
MMNPIQVSPATPADVPALCNLLGILFAQEVEFEPHREAQERGLTAIIEHPEIGHVLVARRDSDVLGMVCLLYTMSTALGARVALLEDLVVQPENRGGGIGSLLLQFAIEFARQRGCERITLLTDGVNDAAQRFYQRHGFSRSSMVPLRLSLR